MSTERPNLTQRYPALTFALGLVLFTVIVATLMHFLAPATGQRPIVTGTAESGMLWKAPMTAASNEGFSIKGCRVEVYDSFVVATNPENGQRHVRPHGYYSDLAIK